MRSCNFSYLFELNHMVIFLYIQHLLLLTIRAARLVRSSRFNSLLSRFMINLKRIRPSMRAMT
jgi:hypothetical protein